MNLKKLLSLFLIIFLVRHKICITGKLPDRWMENEKNSNTATGLNCEDQNPRLFAFCL